MRFDPTLGSNNLGLKKCRIRNHHIFGIARTSAFIWHIWIPLKKFCKRTRRVCVCIVLVHFGRFSQEVNGKSVKLAVWAVSLNFLHDFTLFVVDIHQIRLISLFRHISDHFHFHPILEQKRVIDLIPCRILCCQLKRQFAVTPLHHLRLSQASQADLFIQRHRLESEWESNVHSLKKSFGAIIQKLRRQIIYQTDTALMSKLWMLSLSD